MAVRSRQDGASLDNAILVEATPSPSPIPEDQRRTRSTVRPPAQSAMLPPHSHRRTDATASKPNFKRSKIDETLRTGIDFAKPPSTARGRSKQIDETLVSGKDFGPKKPRRISGPGPGQPSIMDFMTPRDEAGPSRHGASSSSQASAPREAKSLVRPLKRTASGKTIADAISISSASASEDERPRRASTQTGPLLPKRSMVRTESQKSLQSVSSGGGTPVKRGRSQIFNLPEPPIPPDALSRPIFPRTASQTSTREGTARPRQRTTTSEQDQWDLRPGSQEEWFSAAMSQVSSSQQRRSRPPHSQQRPQRSESQSQLQSQSQSQSQYRVLVPETIGAPAMQRTAGKKVLVPETVAVPEENPFLVPSSKRRLSRTSSQLSANGAADSITEDFTIPKPRSASRSTASSSRRPPSPSPDALAWSRLQPTGATPRPSTLAVPSATPPRVNLLAGLARSPTKSPATQPSPMKEDADDPPPPPMTAAMRRREAFLLDDESYRPSPRSKAAKELLRGIKNAPAHLAARPAVRPRRVHSVPGKYTLPTMDTPLEKWPTTKGTTDSGRPPKRRKSEVPAEKERRQSPAPPATPQRQQSQESATSTVTPLPATPPPNLPSLHENVLPTPTVNIEQSPIDDFDSPIPQPQGSHNSSSLKQHLSQTSLHRLSQQGSQNRMSPHNSFKHTPSDCGSDFFAKYAEFDGNVSSPEQSQRRPARLSASPLAQRVALSPRASQRSLGSAEQPAPKPSPKRNLAAELLAEEAENNRRVQEERERKEREREERRAERLRKLRSIEEQGEEVHEESLAKSLPTPDPTSASISPDPAPPRRSTRVTSAPKPAPVRSPPSESSPPPRPLKNRAASMRFKKLYDSHINDPWLLAQANLAEQATSSRDSPGMDAGDGDAVDFNDLTGVDEDLLEQAQRQREADVSDEKAAELESALVFWAAAEEAREPWTEAELAEIEMPKWPPELAPLVTDMDTTTLLSLLSSGVFNTANGTAIPGIGKWLFKLAFGAEESIAAVAAQQLVKHVAACLESDDGIDCSDGGMLDAVWRSLGASSRITQHTESEDLELEVDVRRDRQSAGLLVCELASAMCAQAWLGLCGAHEILPQLLQLAVDGTTTPALRQAVAATVSDILAHRFGSERASDMAFNLASALSHLSTYHKSRVILALGQGTEKTRIISRLLAMEFLAPACMQDQQGNVTSPSELQLLLALQDIIDELNADPDWIDINAKITLYAAASSDSAQFSRLNKHNGERKHTSPFHPFLAMARKRIRNAEHHQPRAMMAKTRIGAIESCIRFTCELLGSIRDNEHLGKNGLQVGRGGQARLAFTTAREMGGKME